MVIALFDFGGGGGWFEPRYITNSYSESSSSVTNGTLNATAATDASGVVSSAVEGAVGVLTSVANATANVAVDAALNAMGRKATGVEGAASPWSGWARKMWRSGLRIECLGVTVRL